VLVGALAGVAGQWLVARSSAKSEAHKWRRDQRTNLYADMLAAVAARVDWVAHQLAADDPAALNRKWDSELEARLLPVAEERRLRGRVHVFASPQVRAQFGVVEQAYRRGRVKHLGARIFQSDDPNDPRFTPQARKDARERMAATYAELERLVRIELGTDR
jgi:hypothetical protein